MAKPGDTEGHARLYSRSYALRVDTRLLFLRTLLRLRSPNMTIHSITRRRIGATEFGSHATSDKEEEESVWTGESFASIAVVECLRSQVR
jgi:hypothetical protein